jgi:aryl-phospho-beta-D-glucosidase BglC (GH1 family)
MNKNMKYIIKFSYFLVVAVCGLCGCKNNHTDNGGTQEKLTTRYRGIGMWNGVGEPDVPDADIDKLGTWNVNLVRWWLIWWVMPNDISVEQYRQFITEQCDILDAKLPVFKRNGIKVCLAMWSFPGGKVENAGQWPPHKIFYDESWQDEFVWTWEYIAARYKDNETVVMYDLMNEPNPGTANNVPNVFLRTAKAIRALGDETEIVYEPVDGDRLKDFKPFDVSGIIYSVHAYYPHVLTHQGMSDGWPIGPVYPGILENEYWDAARLRDLYRDVKRFADDNRVRIFIGEFGCVRWAPDNSAYRYLKDCIEFFEEEGWDWTCFSLQPQCSYNWGATAWSAEHDTIYKSVCASGQETDRLELLKIYWKKNEK